jgi:hypothetical protein
MSIVLPNRMRTAASIALHALPEAVLAFAAALLTLACAQWLAPGPGSAVLAVVLSLSLARSRLDRDRRGRIEAAVALPLVGLAATGVGLLLRDLPWVGAVAFTVGITLSVWLRQFGEAARRAARLIALPFVTVLTVPHVAGSTHGPLPPWLVPVLVALIALGWVSLLDALGRRLRWLAEPAATLFHAAAAPRAGPTGGRRLSATTRMALQMAAALALAFAVGHLVFGTHWPWVVITAFIVHSGNRGRGEVAWKSLLRLGGAAVGTLAAAALAAPTAASGHAGAALILAALFLGTWLRRINYAWWALFVTLALALLQGYGGRPADAAMVERLLARSVDVLRRRLADALAVLAEALDPAAAPEARDPARLAHAFDGVIELAAPFRAARRLGHGAPAAWIDALAACRAPALVLIEHGTASGDARRAVGAARQALKEPARLATALESLRDALPLPSGERACPRLDRGVGVRGQSGEGVR